MKDVKPIAFSEIEKLPAVNSALADRLVSDAIKSIDKKIVVIDDDPTGVQTVHDVSVFTSWDLETMKEAFAEQNSMFFILTNSRGMSHDETVRQHKIIAQNIVAASKNSGKDYIVISRGDSTLRGHYPTETLTLKNEIEDMSDKKFDGEIIYPFFLEGGRYTINGVHYVKEVEQLTPAGQTEFAKDKSFGYTSSYLPEWCEEKSGGVYNADDVTVISIEDLRACNVDKIAGQLAAVHDFGKVAVDSASYDDVKVFAAAFCKAVSQGKHFMFRSAAAITKVLGGVSDRELLVRRDLILPGNKNGGIVLVGSHVKKTSDQLAELHNCKYPIEFIEFNQHRVLEDGGLDDEARRVIKLAEEKISSGKTVAVFTKRERLDFPGDKDEQLAMSVKISDAVTSVIGNLSVQPNFIIAKGGITSSDVGVKALRVHRATVMGQVRPGIPVWQTGSESKFPNMPYIIFPGNVGTVDDLRVIVETLMTD